MVRLAILIICCFLMTQSQAQTLFLSEKGQVKLAPYVYYLQEQGEALTIEDLIEDKNTLAWQKNEKEDINFGFSTSTYWLKIKLNNKYALVTEWVLEIPYPSLDQVDAYFYDSEDKLDAVYYAGDQIKVKNKIISHPHIIFPVNLPPNEDYTLYIRIQTQGSVQVPLTLWQWEDFNYHTLIHFLMQGIFYGMVLLMALYNSVVWLTEKKPIYLYYVSYILFFALFQSSLNGIGFQFIWPEYPELNNLIIPSTIALVMSALSYFMNAFFTFEKSSPRLHLLLKVLGYLYATLAMVCIFIPYSISILMVAAAIIPFVVLVVFLTIYMLKQKHPSAKYFALAWVAYLTGTTFLVANKFGLIPITIFSEYGAQFGAGLEMMFLSLALADQLANTQKAKVHAQESSLQLAHQVNLERDKTIATEKENSQKLESLVSERTDALNTAMEKLQTLSITDALTQVFNRLYFDEHWRIEHKRAYREQTQLALIMLDIDHFKSVNDNYGHPAGDMCLQHVAQCMLQHATRDPDIVCRYGGEEFIVILPGTDDAGALAVANNIREQITRLKLDWQGQTLTLTASLGISSLITENSQVDDRQVMINQADQAMYQAKDSGRNRVVLYKAEH